MQNTWKGNGHRVSEQDSVTTVVSGIGVIISIIKQLNVEFPHLIIKPQPFCSHDSKGYHLSSKVALLVWIHHNLRGTIQRLHPVFQISAPAPLSLLGRHHRSPTLTQQTPLSGLFTYEAPCPSTTPIHFLHRKQSNLSNIISSSTSLTYFRKKKKKPSVTTFDTV